MADASRLPFPSPSVILGQAHDTASSDEPAVPPEPPPPRPKKHAKRPSNSGKENTKRAAAKKGPSVKPKQTKSRNGCATCKLKRLKCGEEKPGCLQCAKRNIVCGGYKKTFQWREFPNGQATPPPTFTPKQAKPGGKANVQAGLSASDSPLGQQHGRQDSKNPSSDAHHSDLMDNLPDMTPSSRAIFNPDIQFTHRTRSFAPANGNGASPSLTQYLQDDLSQNLPDDHAVAQDFVSFSMPQDLDFPYLTSGQDPELDETVFPDLIGPISASDFSSLQWPSQFTSPDSPFAMTTPEDMPDFWNSLSPSFFQQPGHPLQSVEFLWDHFDKMTCGILSVMDGRDENPWRTLVLPLADHSAGLRHALLSMSAFHAAADHPQLKVVGGEHKATSIRHISDGMRYDSMGIQTQIATALALTFAESWDQHITTGVMHIKGAAAFVKNALEHHRRNPMIGVDLLRLKFLCNAWVYMDVISRLTGVDCDEKTDFQTSLWTTEVPGNEEPGYGLKFDNIGIDACLDPLMGCASTLFPTIGNVANLVRRACRSQRSSPSIISTARDLMAELEEWNTPAYIQRPQDPATNVQHALQTAEAYRYATMLHLHQAVPELPTSSGDPDENYAQRVLQYLATVPLTSRMLNVHIYPLMVAGCMASEAEDRDWVRGRWDVMRKRMRIGVIDKCLAVTEEVWRRKDDYEARSPRQRNLVVTADLSPGRQRTKAQPEKTGSNSPEPGRAGMVFTLANPNEKGRNFSNGNFDVAYSVRGHLHWVGVMWDWGIEPLLG
ncbi:uncharacterized protein MYCFIDRAFT_127593 [Pseudocercospora fijiensis CIRAD86]|uniref:Zn(2)-C6 fungal-type domain-containing protein n=1 Tax=Pseudocercospora fijiensis (strain CIRAD86) TaxID=383855 RepID=N1Q8L3_PSEFD|nr:uncharacterized protein MYCFIDRAFT_127593 [Pseudocercospora fijiensis CIRAD86]EME87262.1 hypothetical protein MYCFIDRAFT_127593 [Pseudocercospora fijiensis CIRAD86]